MKTKPLLLTAVSICFFTTSQLLAGGYEGQDRGGGDPNTISESAITFLLTGNGLKLALINYATTLSLDQMDESTEEGQIVKSPFVRMLKDNQIKEDIQNSTYVIEDSCQDTLKQEVPASTQIGVLGSSICFNIKKLTKEYQSLTQEQMMIRLASLAWHEHVHHFQNPGSPSQINENEAYLAAAYVQLTAKLVQVPLLKWSPPRDSNYIGCDELYMESKKKIEKEYNDFISKTARRDLNLIYSSLSLVSSSAATNVTGLFSFGFAVIPTGTLVYIKKYNGRNRGEELRLILRSFERSVYLLHQARIGGGYTIEYFMSKFWEKTHRYDIAPKDLANSIESLNAEKVFCQNPEKLDTDVEIIRKALVKLGVNAQVVEISSLPQNESRQ